ncbi:MULTISPECIES: carbohydrate ABC transporter permease [unclassified Microbacterium]|uniref:carbohydrate ABC transporter permease n=1 Tax=unclassified Microbacterium TaxID=2609290 RepID=UPI000EA9B943|nr:MULTISPECIES: sugar ABC transporter permease [unclassified Microbacterium]MBT2484001.1 sugar ABC transporter permease [Microbacterium sp. ISL-108]RKN66961.1 sugar ABC transporter permease [Microbacterium sp. CGR2]
MATTMTSPAREHTRRPAHPARPRRRWSREALVAMLFVAPAALGFAVFTLVPAIRGFYYSFTDYDVFQPESFVGTANYERMIADPVFWNSLVVTLQYVVINIVFQTIFALVLAVLMHRLTQSLVVRGIILGPYLVANVIVALVWFWILDYQIGIGNQFIEWLGLDRLAFFGDPALAIPTIAFINVWRHVGYTALLIFAGLQMIPKEMYEASAIDGAGEWKTFWRITVPLLRPVLAVVLVVSIIGSFQIFDTVAVTTQGGPVNATRVIYYYIYDLAFNRYEFGYASAVSVALFLILAGVSLLQLRLTRANQSDLA